MWVIMEVLKRLKTKRTNEHTRKEAPDFIGEQ